jgi:protein TonB
VLSVLIHWALLEVFVGGLFRDDLSAEGSAPIEIQFVPWDEQGLPKLEKQIVSFEKQTAEKPDDSRFLAKHDHRVEKETIVKDTALDSFMASPALPPMMAPRSGSFEQLMKSGRERKIAAIFPEQILRDTAQSQSGSQVRSPISPGGGMVDYVENVDVGGEVLLNTAEFKYYGYFSRMRDKVRHYWVNNIQNAALKTYMVGRPLAGDMDHETRVILTLGEEGQIKTVKVLKSSGNLDLDKATVDAFMQSGPFPNPPKDLLKKNNEIEVSWSFLVKVT